MEKQDNELLLHVYEDADMGEYTISELIIYLENKDNKIKKELNDILYKYKEFKENIKKYLKKNNFEISEAKKINKIMAKNGIKKEVSDDNSDSAIADMLIKGISMGTIDMEKKINSYKSIVNNETLDIANDFLSFQHNKIKILKKYL